MLNVDLHLLQKDFYTIAGLIDIGPEMVKI